MLEIHVLYQAETLESLRNLRSDHDKSFQANLEKIQDSFRQRTPEASLCDHHILREIRQMLQEEAEDRPSISQVCDNLAFIDTFQKREGGDALFGNCCRRLFMTHEEHDREVSRIKAECKREVALNNENYEEKLEDLNAEWGNSQTQTLLYKQMVDDTNREIAQLKDKISAFTAIIENDKLDRNQYVACPICATLWPSSEDVSKHMNVKHPAKSRVWTEATGPGQVTRTPLVRAHVPEDQSASYHCSVCGLKFFGTGISPIIQSESHFRNEHLGQAASLRKINLKQQHHHHHQNHQGGSKYMV